jgi:tetratricopeptide (TPR) repeat protein
MNAALDILRDKEDCLKMSGAICLGTDGFVWLQCSKFELAERSLEKSWKGNLNEWVLSDWTCHTFALWMESVVGPDWLRATNSVDKRKAKKLFHNSTLVYLLYPNQRSAINRARGRTMFILGKTSKAERYFERSVQQARKLGFQFGLARSLLDLAAIKPADRDENRAEAIELLNQMASVIPRAESWLLGDQYDEAVVAPEFDLKAWEREHGVISRPAREPSR